MDCPIHTFNAAPYIPAKNNLQPPIDLSSSEVHVNHMSDLRRAKTNARDWRAYLTPEEKRELARLDKIIAKAEAMAELPRLRRGRIQNRATVRAGYASQ
jgi:hypothetical protein